MMRTRVQPTATSPYRLPHVRRNSSSQSDARSVVEPDVGFVPRRLHQLMIAQEIADTERGRAGLSGAEDITRTPQLQVLLGDHESVGGLSHHLQPLARLVREWILVRRMQDETCDPRPTRPRN